MPLLNAVRRRMGLADASTPAPVAATPRPQRDLLAPIFAPTPTPTSWPSSPAPSDPFRGLKGFGDFTRGVGDAVGGLLEGAAKVPVLGGVLQGIGAVYDNTVTPALGLIEKTAGDGAAQRAYEENSRTLEGGQASPLDVFATARGLRAAHEASQREASSIASDPRRPALERVLAGVQSGAQTVAENVLPVPGLNVIGPSVNAFRAGASVARDTARVAADVPKPRPVSPRAPSAFDVAPNKPVQFVDQYGADLTRAVERRVPRSSLEPAALDPRDLGFRPDTFSRLDPDLQRSIRQDHLDAGGFTEQRRGVQPIEETKRLAESVGIDPTTVQPGKAFNAEEIYSLTKSVAQAATERRTIQAEIANLGGPSFATAEQNARLLLASVKQASYERVLAGGRTEAGRALRIQREALEAAIADPSERTYQKALTAVGGRDNAEALMKGLNDIYARAVPDAVKEADTMAFLRSATKSGTAAQVKEYWVNSILSNPYTHEVNTLSNTAFALTQFPTRYLAAGTDAVRAAVSRTPREVYFSEANASVVGAMRGITTGVRKGLDIALHGYSVEDTAKFRETGKLGQTQAIGGIVGTFVNIPSRLMSAADAVFKGIAYSSEIYALAARDAAKAGIRGEAFAQRVAELVKNPTAEMADAATKHAKYVTFQSDPGEMTALVQKMRRAGLAGEALGFVIPFIQTPTNLFKRGLEYSPLGYTQVVRAATGADRSIAFARASLGSAVMAAMVPQFFTGNLTGPAPTNVAERDAFFRSGKMPYSIKIGDQWIEYKRLEPTFSFLRPFAAALQAAKEAGGPPSEEMIGPALGAFVSALKDQSYLTGVENLLNAMDDPARFGERFIAQLATGFVPYSGLLRGVARAEDPYIRNPKGIVQNIEAGLPGASRNVPPKLDLLRGEPVLRQPTQQGLGAFLNPVKASPAQTNAVDAEIAQVQRHVPELGQTGAVGSSIRGEKLDQQGRFRYQELAAPYDELLALINSPAYAAMSWTEKAKAIDSTRAKARAAAANALTAERNPTNLLGSLFDGKDNPAKAGDLLGPLFAGRGQGAGAPKSGSLLEGVFGPPRSSASSTSGDIASIVRNTARQSGIDPRLALAVAHVESGLNPQAVGDNGESHGVFQERLIYGRGGFTTPDPDPARQTQRFAADVRAFLAQNPNASPGAIAAAVQRPYDPAGYARKVDAAYSNIGL